MPKPMNSWETTLAGIATLLTALSGVINAYLGGDVQTTITLLGSSLIPAAIGLIRAKDGNKTTNPLTGETEKANP